jgi:hypothetical protein
MTLLRLAACTDTRAAASVGELRWSVLRAFLGNGMNEIIEGYGKTTHERLLRDCDCADDRVEKGIRRLSRVPAG